MLVMIFESARLIKRVGWDDNTIITNREGMEREE